MCGISAILKLHGQSLSDVDIVSERSMAHAIRFRGPDARTHVSNGPLCATFFRLAINGVTNGSQPFITRNGSLFLWTNGEIYNHRELVAKYGLEREISTRSDCEVLLPLFERFGAGFLDDVIGVYSVVIWEPLEARLWLARDRLGVRPLFYSKTRDSFLVCSEVKGLIVHPACERSVDWDRVLTDPWLSGDACLQPEEPTCFFKGIEQVPSGSIISIDAASGVVTEHSHWKALPDASARHQLSAGDVFAGYRRLLADACELNARAEMRVGIFLSGGIDSSAIASLCQHQADITAFTVQSPSTASSGDLEAAKAVARHLKIPLKCIDFGAGRLASVPDLWRRLLWVCENPYFGADQTYKVMLYRYVAAECPDMKVILTGQGADEIAGGYTTMLSWSDTATWESFKETLAYLHHNYQMRRQRPLLRIWEDRAGRPLFRPAGAREPSLPLRDDWQAYMATKLRDLQIYNLWNDDRVSSVNGIESRVPFLDHRLVELLAGVPTEDRETVFWDKAVLRQALVGRLPESIRTRPKVPFFFGQGEEHTHRLMLEILSSDDFAVVADAFAPGTIARELIDLDQLIDVIRDARESGDSETAVSAQRLANVAILDRIVRNGGLDTHASSLPILDCHDEHFALTAS